jgi:hypothetical protein
MVYPGILFKNNHIIDASILDNNEQIVNIYVKEIYIFKYNDVSTYNRPYDINIRAIYYILQNQTVNDNSITNLIQSGIRDTFIMDYKLHNEVLIDNNKIKFSVNNPPLYHSVLNKIPNITGTFTVRFTNDAMNRFSKWLNKHF